MKYKKESKDIAIKIEQFLSKFVLMVIFKIDV